MEAMVLLPAPVAPTSAIFSPFLAWIETSRRMGMPALYSNETSSSSNAVSSSRAEVFEVWGRAGASSSLFSSSSKTRSAPAIADWRSV
jgi:hypothetical protein